MKTDDRIFQSGEEVFIKGSKIKATITEMFFENGVWMVRLKGWSQALTQEQIEKKTK